MANAASNPKSGTPGVKEPARRPTHEGPALKGTFVSVMLLGGFLVLAWVTIFVMFLGRN